MVRSEYPLPPIFDRWETDYMYIYLFIFELLNKVGLQSINFFCVAENVRIGTYEPLVHENVRDRTWNFVHIQISIKISLKKERLSNKIMLVNY